MDTTDTAARACVACKQYKRKCNKTLPSCSTCSRLRRVCNYTTTDPTQAPPRDEITLLRARVEELEKSVNKSNTTNTAWSTSSASSPVHGINGLIQSSVSSSLFFLDQMAFTNLHCRIPPMVVPVPTDITSVLKDEHDAPRGMRQLMSRYFDAVHGWMPIISKVRIQRVLDRSIGDIQADTAFLLSCMKLLLQTPENESLPADLPLYGIVKAASLRLDIAGLQSLMAIQGGLLIAVYELGHGIYPAAYMTVAQCARQAISLGVHDRKAPEFLQPWADWEEEIRVWWFIMMLDRHVTVGRECRPLCTEDPKKHTPLPADSQTWQQGAATAPERLYISSPTAATTSPYARLAQAYNLLGRVIRHCDDHDQGLSFMLDEMSTLHQAISALLGLIRTDEAEESYVALAVCFSALLKLHKNFLYCSFRQGFADGADSQMASRIREYTDQSFSTMRDISLQALTLAQSLERHTVILGVDKLSPLVLHCLYRAAFWLSYLAAANREDRFLLGASILRGVLKALSSRWRVASTYLEMLETVCAEIRADD